MSVFSFIFLKKKLPAIQNTVVFTTAGSRWFDQHLQIRFSIGLKAPGEKTEAELTHKMTEYDDVVDVNGPEAATAEGPGWGGPGSPGADSGPRTPPDSADGRGRRSEASGGKNKTKQNKKNNRNSRNGFRFSFFFFFLSSAVTRTTLTRFRPLTRRRPGEPFPTN